MICVRKIIICLVLSLYGCGYTKVKVDNKFVSDLSKKYNKNSSFTEYQNQYIKQFSEWYKSFSNSELQDLISLALVNNLDITKALYNLQESALQLGTQRQALYPSLSAQSQYTQQSYSKEASKVLSSKRNTTLLSIGLAASYEFDIWGKNYSAYKGAKSRVNAYKAEFEGVKISIIASIMNLWVNLMSLRQEKEILENKITDIQKVLEIQESSFSSGSTSVTDLFQQQSQLWGIQNLLKDIQYAEAETLRSINILIGRDPLETLTITSNRLPKLPKLPNNELNIIVLANRPDIKSAFYNLVALEWDVKVAKLSMLPSFSIQSLINIGSNGISISFDRWLIKTFFDASIPLFRAGALYNKEQALKFLSKASVVNYKQVVFNAINEVKTALDNELKYIESLENITKQVNLMEETKVQLQNKYLNGSASYLEFLSTDSNILDLKIALIKQQKDMLLNRISFYRALGINVGYKEEVNVNK